MVDEVVARKILNKYREAWIEQDIDKILTIFNNDGIYHEYQFKKPYVGHKEIAAYWKSKVVDEQSKIKFKLLKMYVCKDTVIAEWDASFNSNVKKARIHLREVGIMEIKNDKIDSYREYWHSEVLNK